LADSLFTGDPDPVLPSTIEVHDAPFDVQQSDELGGEIEDGAVSGLASSQGLLSRTFARHIAAHLNGPAHLPLGVQDRHAMNHPGTAVGRVHAASGDLFRLHGHRDRTGITGFARCMPDLEAATPHQLLATKTYRVGRGPVGPQDAVVHILIDHQIREAIEDRDFLPLGMTQGFFGTDPVLDIAADPDNTRDLALAITKGHLGGRHPPELTGGAPDALHLVHDRLARGDNALLVGMGIPSVLGCEEIEVALAQGLLGAADAQHFGLRTIYPGEAAGRVLEVDGIGHGLEQGFELSPVGDLSAKDLFDVRRDIGAFQQNL